MVTMVLKGVVTYAAQRDAITKDLKPERVHICIPIDDFLPVEGQGHHRRESESVIPDGPDISRDYGIWTEYNLKPPLQQRDDFIPVERHGRQERVRESIFPDSPDRSDKK